MDSEWRTAWVDTATQNYHQGRSLKESPGWLDEVPGAGGSRQIGIYGCL